MKYGLSFLEGADVAENVAKERKDVVHVLSHAGDVMSIRADSDDLAAKLAEAAEKFLGGKKGACLVHAAGVDLQALSVGYENAKDLIGDLAEILVMYRLVGGVVSRLTNVGQVPEHVKI